MRQRAVIWVFLALQVCVGELCAQTNTVSLNMSNVSIEQVLNAIEGTTGYYFLYNNKLVNVDRIVSIRVRGSSIQQTLNTLFKDTDIEYSIRGNQIVLSAKQDASADLVEYKMIEGRVIDRYREPVIGANIFIETLKEGTTTDMGGRFSLLVSIGDTLRISYIGFETKRVAVMSPSFLTILLNENMNQLDEVVVIGYGTQRTEEVSSSVTRVRIPNFNKTPAIYPAQLIQGRVAGLTVMQPNSDPNIAPSLQIRGISSIKGNNEPLIVIDGIPGDMRSLNAVAPEEIESIDVLKDGSAAAIYGTRGNNGVVIVTTKNPRSGDFKVEYAGYLYTEQVIDYPDVLSADEYLAYGRATGNPRIKDEGGRDNAYQLMMREHNMSHAQNLSITGGSNRMNYRASLNFRDNQGISLRSDRQSLNGSFIVNHLTLQNRLQLTYNLSSTHTTAHFPDENTDYAPFYVALRRNPTLPVYNSEGKFHESYSGYEDYNPVAYILQQSRNAEYNTLMGSFNATLDILSGWRTKLFLAFERNEDYLNHYRSRLAYRSVKNGDEGEAYKKYLRNINRIVEWTTWYDHSFDRHSLTALAGYSFQNFDNEWFEARNNGFITDAFQTHNIGAGSYLKDGKAWMASEKKSSKLIAFFARFNYNYAGKYLLSASIRREGSSKFGHFNKWATFPSVSAGWMINKEGFLADAGYIDMLKLRAGYGITGSLPNDPYMSIIKFGTGAGSWDALNGRWITATYGPMNNPNPNLKWEKNSSLNLGVDFSFAGNRLAGAIDAYIRTTRNLIGEYTAQQPSLIYNSILTNVGTMQNAGVELSLKGELVKAQDFQYTAHLTFAYEQNELTSLSNDLYKSSYEDRYALPSPGNLGYAQRLQEGQPVGSFFGYICDGITDDGKWNIRDLDGKDGLSESDKTFIGNGLPSVKASLLNSFIYKNIDFSVFLTGMFDYDILNESRIFMGTTSGIDKTGTNMYADALKYRLVDDPIFSDFYLEKGDYLRIENVTAGYSFPKFLPAFIEQCRVYVNVKNLATITGYSGSSPVININGLEAGIDKRGIYPNTMTFTVGATLTF